MKKNNAVRLAVALCVSLALLLAGLTLHRYQKEHSRGIFTRTVSDEDYQKQFDAYLDKLFAQEVAASTIQLHYTLKNPENYGISDYKVTYGEVSEEGWREASLVLENIQQVLEGVQKQRLTRSQQLTYDILLSETETELSATDLYLYQEMLRPSTGIQAELPVLMAEYAFYDEGDVEDYLALLSEIKTYFRQILLFQMEKANAGLFMPGFAAEDILSQCRNFVGQTENKYLLETFDEKIETVAGLTGEQKERYREENRLTVAESVIPAYELLMQGLEKLKASSQNQQGLCYLPRGKEYYEYLVKSYTGSGRGIKELQQAVTRQRAEDLSEVAGLIGENPELLAQVLSYGYPQQEPVAILGELQEKMKGDFPAPPDTSFTVKYVPPALEEFMAPAFYLAVPIDDISKNSIYINGAGNYQKLKLYTTLAHEGYPGHLYQNIMERSQDFPAIRSLLGTSGYSEGWATYVEMISYGYADLEPALAELLQREQSALLSLYATADLEIHYDGWGLEDMKAFFGEYQITDEAVLTDIYHLIVEEPAHYLKYYIGYLEFLDLKAYAQDLYGEQYSDYRFHDALMKLGPAEFPILKQYLLLDTSVSGQR